MRNIFRIILSDKLAHTHKRLYTSTITIIKKKTIDALRQFFFQRKIDFEMS